MGTIWNGAAPSPFPGGVTALNGSAIRNTLSTGTSNAALRGSITDAIKASAATTAHGAQALARGALDEIPQEVLDEGISQLSAAWAEKKDMKQAMAEFFAGLPQLIATSGLLGAGGEHIAQSGGGQPQTGRPQQPQTQIPANTTSGDPSPSAAKPSRPPLDVGTSKKLIANVEKIAEHRPLNPVEKADLDQAKGVVVADAQKLIDNISKLRPEAQQHPTTLARLNEAKNLVEAHGGTPGLGGSLNTQQQSTEGRNPYRKPDGTLLIPERTSSSSDPALAQHEKKLHDIANDQPRADKLYNDIPDAKGGKVIGTDIARELLPEFAESREGKINYTNATGRVAQAYAKDRLWREIEHPQGRRELMFTAGGVASGKSTAVTDGMVAASDLVYDGTLREADWAIQTIEHAIAKGWNVEINYVQRPLPLVLQGAIDRAHSKGRWGSLADLPAIHQAAQQSIIKIAKHFEGKPHFSLNILLNDGKTLAEKTQIAETRTD